MVHIGDTSATGVMRFGTVGMNPLKTATTRNASLRIGTKKGYVKI